jgi:hypothetical protein
MFRKVLVFGEFLNHVHPKLHGFFNKKTPNEFSKKKSSNGAPPLVPYLSGGAISQLTEVKCCSSRSLPSFLPSIGANVTTNI